MQHTFDFTGDKTDVINALRQDFDNQALPFFEKIEKERVGSSKDGSYTHQFSSSNGLIYNGIITLSGLNVKWNFSTSFSYCSASDANDQGRCYALFFQDCVLVITNHSLRRYNERTLGEMETSVDRIFHKYVEKRMDYALISKVRSRTSLNLFMRIPGGAFLYSLILDQNYWFKTYISDYQMYESQVCLSDLLDDIESFQIESGISITSITSDSIEKQLLSWIEGSDGRKEIFSKALNAAVNIFNNAPGEDQDDDDRKMLSRFKEIQEELKK